MSNDGTVRCDDCDSAVTLVKTDEPAHVLQCECDIKHIDISEIVGKSNHFHPISGSWSDIDVGSQLK
jgi:hypothetical protein